MKMKIKIPLDLARCNAETFLSSLTFYYDGVGLSFVSLNFNRSSDFFYPSYTKPFTSEHPLPFRHFA